MYLKHEVVDSGGVKLLRANNFFCQVKNHPVKAQAPDQAGSVILAKEPTLEVLSLYEEVFFFLLYVKDLKNRRPFPSVFFLMSSLGCLQSVAT